MNKTVGFIGFGNMAKAMAGGMILGGVADKKNIIVSASTDKTLKNAQDTYGINVTMDNKEVAKKSDILFLAVKPNVYHLVINEIKDCISPDTLIVTIAAGQTIEDVEKMFGKEIRLIRTMPNTPAMVMEGMSLICPGENAALEDLEDVLRIFNSFGKCEVVEEALIDTAGSLSGCGPAFVYVFIEALADAAVESGVKREMAYKLASQMVMGSAKMVLETKEHPGKLKDNVCSPGGTTIKGVNALEYSGFRGNVIDALLSSIEKSKEMSGNK